MSSETAAANDGFAETGEYLRFAEFLASCVRYRYVGVGVGPPGVGKTLSAKHYSSWDVLEPLFPRYAYTRKPPPEVASCRGVFYTAPVANSPALIAGEVERRRNLVNWLVDAAGREGTTQEPAEIPDRTALLIVDEANRLKVTALEQPRDMYDRDGFGLVLLGMPGLEKSRARYPQPCSRVGFVHRFHALGAAEARLVITERAHLLDVGLPQEAFTDGEAVAATVRITGGNFRLMQRLLQQVERVLAINDLAVVTPEAVEAAREALVIGAA
jgi:DNA transposition AAA+ family ATPase